MDIWGPTLGVNMGRGVGAPHVRACVVELISDEARNLRKILGTNMALIRSGNVIVVHPVEAHIL